MVGGYGKKFLIKNISAIFFLILIYVRTINFFVGSQAVPLQCFFDTIASGSLAERLNALVLKTSKPSRVSRVRIPVSPPVLITQTRVQQCF